MSGRTILLVFTGAIATAAQPSDCRPCHAQIYDTYASTPMGRSFYRPAPAASIEDWERNNKFFHQPSSQYFEMTRRGGEFFVRRYQLDRRQRQVNILERQVTHIMGSGTRARSYLHRTAEGRLVVLPVSWYTQEQRWGMAPGYDRPHHMGFSRTVNHKCMFCHNAYPAVPPGQDRQGFDDDVRFPAELPMGIDCQRCHGSGADHVRAASAAEPLASVRSSIVNPARLSRDLQLDLCMQCHLETTSNRLPESYRRFGRGFYSYRPGEPLGDYMVHFDEPHGKGREDRFEIVSAAYRMRQSSCFLEGQLTCITCHSPHRPVATTQAAAYYRERCFACHSAASARLHKLSANAFQQADCIACHMPKRRTEDVTHVVMTDHRIERRRPARDLLAPLAEKQEKELTYRGEVVLYRPEPGLTAPELDVYLGIAQVNEGANLRRGADMLADALKKSGMKHPEPWFELAQAQSALGRKQEARANYLRALAIDPSFTQAENNLGNLLADLRETREAIRHYRRGLALNPSSSEIHTNLGLAWLELGNQRAAEGAFLQAIAANPLFSLARLNLGSVYLSQGKIEEARSHLESALAINPDEVRAHNNLGLALLELGKRDDAIELFRWALHNGSANEQEAARRNLARAGVDGVR